MMKNSIKYIQLILCLCVVSACEDELIKLPLDSPSSETFYSNQAELELALNGVYTGLWWELSSSVPPMYQLLDVASDLAFYRGGSEIGVFARGSHTSQTGMFLDTWFHFYESIARANSLINNMHRAEGKVSEAFLIQVEAEARFLRAFFYHWLVELYGDVPLLTEVPTPDNAQIGRSSKSEVLAQIMDDLDFAAQNLTPRAGGDKGLASRAAALALKARSALYNGNYSDVIDATQAIIQSGEYQLYPDYEQLFKYVGERNSGVILDLPLKIGVKAYQYGQRVGTRNSGTTSAYVPSQFLIDSYQAIDGLPIDQSPLYDPANPFANRDPRLDASIVRPQGMFLGYVFETHPDSVMTSRLVDGEWERVPNQDATNPFASYTGYVWRKYLDEQDFPQNIRQTELNPILIRFAEVLLMYAEAKIESNDIDQSVLDALNQVRARGYGVEFSQTGLYPEIVTTDQNALRREVRYERKIELASEGFRWFDLKRWGILDDVMSGVFRGRPVDGYSTIPNAPTIRVDLGYHPDYGSNSDLYRNVEVRLFDNERDRLWPIPQAELDVNDVIQQNDGY
ncbi:MAG: RagB/SusD family nutrient uptake outer membrane protein [Cyclobacteriaceae bacterium]